MAVRGLGVTLIAGLAPLALAFSAPAAYAAQGSRLSVVASAILDAPVLQGAPPSPPPDVSSGGDGGGDDGAGEFLRLLNAAEQASVLSDWLQRSRIYKLSDNADLVRAHADQIGELQALQNFDTSETGPDGRRMLLGLFDDTQLWAVASAEVSRTAGLLVSRLCVYPAELNDPESTTALRLVHALHVLADAIETPINLQDGCKSATLSEVTERYRREFD